MSIELESIPAELFGGGHVVHLATLRPDGSPSSRPLWTIVVDGRVVFFTQDTSAKARHIAGDPRVALSVTDKRNPYRSAWLRGRVARTIEGDDALAIIDRISTPTSAGRSRCGAAPSSSSTARRRARPTYRSKTTSERGAPPARALSSTRAGGAAIVLSPYLVVEERDRGRYPSIEVPRAKSSRSLDRGITNTSVL